MTSHCGHVTGIMVNVTGELSPFNGAVIAVAAIIQ